MSSNKKATKRALDIIITVPILVLIAPLMFIIIIAILILSGEPALYKQKRPGEAGIPFVIFKFRTMSNKIDKDGKLLPDSHRICKFGKFLREMSFDELPTLWNVIKGDMSLVGPRPLLMEYLNKYTPEQSRRHETKPGITGWAQINGRNAITWEEKFAYDVWYVDNWNLKLDLKILWLTIIKVIKREGINQSGSETMEKFQGIGGPYGK